MKVEEIGRAGSKVTLRVEAAPEEYRDAVCAGVRAFFLKPTDAVPAPGEVDAILENVVGADGDVAAAKLDAAVNWLLPRAIEQSGLHPICDPRGTFPATPGAGEPLVFEVSMYPRPTIELSSYDPVSIEVEAPSVTEAEIDERVAEITAEAVRNGTLAHNLDGTPDAIDDAWVAANIPDEGCNTVADLRSQLAAAGRQYKRQQFVQYQMSLATAELTKRLVEDVAPDLVDVLRQAMLEELRDQLAAQHMTLDDFLKAQQMTREALEVNAQNQARETLRQSAALDAVFRHEKLEVTDEDRRAALSAIAPGNEDEAEAQMRETGYLFAIEESAERLKAGGWVLAQASVTVL